MIHQTKNLQRQKKTLCPHTLLSDKSTEHGNGIRKDFLTYLQEWIENGKAVCKSRHSGLHWFQGSSLVSKLLTSPNGYVDLVTD